MAIKYRGTGKFKYSIDVLGQFPLDTRLIVESKVDLTNFKTTFIIDEIDVWYVGMIVSCLEPIYTDTPSEQATNAIMANSEKRIFFIVR